MSYDILIGIERKICPIVSSKISETRLWKMKLNMNMSQVLEMAW